MTPRTQHGITSSRSSYQKGTKHVEADKVNDGKLAAAVLAGRVGLIGGAFLTGLAELAGQHDLLPGLTCCTSGGWKKGAQELAANMCSCYHIMSSTIISDVKQ